MLFISTCITGLNTSAQIIISDDKDSLIIKNNDDKEASFDFEFRSTESLDTIDYIPNSIGSIILTKDQESTVAPSNWATTETQASITELTEGKKDRTDEKEVTPGFELLIMIFSLFIVLVYKRKK